MHSTIRSFTFVAQHLLILFVLCVHAVCPPGQYFNTGSSFCSQCTPGTAGDGTTNDTCVTCNAGYFASWYGNSVCSPCVMGTYSPSGSASCTLCAAGWYNPSAGQASCTSCPGGYFSTAVGATSSATCQPCSAVGTYSPPGSSMCSSCPGGTYSTAAPVSSCTSCQPGYYNPSTGSIDPADCNNICSSGTYCGGGCASCPLCPAGSYANASGRSSCTLCPAGYYNPKTGSFSPSDCLICPPGGYSFSGQGLCTLCAQGTYNDQPERTSPCIQCPPGSYNPSVGSVSNASCLPCAVGSNSSSPGASACASCPAGTFADHLGMTECTVCPVGRYNCLLGQNSSASCLPCPVGTNTSVAGSSSCRPCPSGTYANVSGTSFCPRCDAGHYNPLTNQSSCAPCASGMYAPGLGSLTCASCPNGTYANAQSASSSCLPCPAGTYGPSQGLASEAQCVACPLGTYNPFNGSFALSACLRCPVNTFGNTTGMARCTSCSDQFVNPSLGSFLPTDCVMNCSYGNKTLVGVSTTLASLNLDRRCTNLTLINPTVGSNTTLNISLAEVADAAYLPSDFVLTVRLIRCNVISGGAIIVDAGNLGQRSRNDTADSNSSIYLVSIESLMSVNGGLLFCGSFPSDSKVVVSSLNASVSVSSVASPGAFTGASTLTYLLGSLPESAYVLGLLKCVVVANLTMERSSLEIQLATFSATASASTALILILGAVSFADESRLVIANATLTSMTAASAAIYVGQPSSLEFVNASEFVIFGCALLPSPQATLQTSSDDGSLYAGIVFNSSRLLLSQLSSFRMISLAAARFVSSPDSSVTIESRSSWQISACAFASPLLFQSAFDCRSNITLANESAMLVTGSTFRVLGFVVASAAVGEVPSVLSFSWLNLSDTGSYLAISGNVLTQKQLCMQRQFCIRASGGAFVAGFLLVSENSCSLPARNETSSAFWNGAVRTLTQRLGLVLDKCNRINNASFPLDPGVGGFPLMTTRSTPASTCGACDPGVDCFAPRSASSALSCTTQPLVPSLDFGSGSVFTQCRCYSSPAYTIPGSGSLCLPSSTVQLVRTPSASVSDEATATGSRTESGASPSTTSSNSSEAMTESHLSSQTRETQSSSNTSSVSSTRWRKSLSSTLNLTLTYSLATTASNTESQRTVSGSVSQASGNVTFSRSVTETQKTLVRSASQTSICMTVSRTRRLTISAKNLSNSISISPSLAFIVSPSRFVSAAVAGFATASVAVGVASAALGGADAASDMQAIVILSSSRCAESRRGGSDPRMAPGIYQLATPFALSDTALGALGGNMIVFVGIGSMQVVVAAFALLLAERRRIAVNSISAKLLKATCVARLPGLLLLSVTALHQSTLFTSLRLVTSADSPSSLVEVIFGVCGLLIAVAVPLAACVLMTKFPRRFVEYGYPTVAGRKGVCQWCPSLVSKQFFPVGVIYPECAGAFLSSLISRWRKLNLVYVLVPYISSLLANIVAVLPATSPLWLCMTALFASAAVHIALGMLMLISRCTRFPISAVTSGLGILVTASLHLQIGSNYLGGIEATVTTQAALSIARTGVGIVCLLIERTIMSSQAVSYSSVLWTVGDGGVTLCKSIGEVDVTENAHMKHFDAVNSLENADFLYTGPESEEVGVDSCHEMHVIARGSDDTDDDDSSGSDNSSEFDGGFALPPLLPLMDDHASSSLNMFGEASGVVLGSVANTPFDESRLRDNPLSRIEEVLHEVDLAVRNKL